MQNFRLIAEKFKVGDDNQLYSKKLDSENKILLLKIPYESEKLTLFNKFMTIQDISYRRLYRDIIEHKYKWKSLRNDCLKFELCSKLPYLYKINNKQNL